MTPNTSVTGGGMEQATMNEKLTEQTETVAEAEAPRRIVQPIVGCDPLESVRVRMAAFLANHGGRCTHLQWIRELSLTKRHIADQLTREMVRKTKRHFIANIKADPQKRSEV